MQVPRPNNDYFAKGIAANMINMQGASIAGLPAFNMQSRAQNHIGKLYN